MKLSAKVEYACRAIIALGQQPLGSPLQTKVVCDEYDIPKDFLSHIMLSLKAAGLVFSVRGCRGGYCLSRDTKSISLGDVVRALHGDRQAEHKALAPLSEALSSLEWAVLDRITIAELAEGGKLLHGDAAG